jgi:NAD(P)H dehydrogenase (quinone)
MPATHLRVTMFLQWVLYISDLVRHGRYVMPFDPTNTADRPTR